MIYVGRTDDFSIPGYEPKIYKKKKKERENIDSRNKYTGDQNIGVFTMDLKLTKISMLKKIEHKGKNFNRKVEALTVNKKGIISKKIIKF